MIISISGYIGSGKDEVAKMIQYLTCKHGIQGTRTYQECEGKIDNEGYGYSNFTDYNSTWEIKKFAAKLKQIASLLTGIPVEKFEDQEFKLTELGREWDYTILGSVNKVMTVRYFLQKLGTEAIRDGLHINTWCNALMADYKIVGMTDGWVPSYNNPDNSGLDQPAEPIYLNWIISDVRYPNEAKVVKDHGGVIWRINRPPSSIYVSRGPDDIQEVPFDPTNKVHTDLYEGERLRKHPSETSLDDWPFDAVINNNGTLEDLLVQVQTLLKTQQII